MAIDIGAVQGRRTASNPLGVSLPKAQAYNRNQRVLSNLQSVKSGASAAPNWIDTSSAANAMQDIYNVRDYNNAAAAAATRDARQWQENMFGRQMEYNSAEAAANREWQEYMSNTAHQREVKDLINAGLNPVLSANNGASTPAGSAASAALPSTTPSEVDMSASTNLTNLLTAMIGADTAIKTTNLTANNQKDIAKMNMSLSKLITEMNNNTQLMINAAKMSNDKYLGELAAKTSIKTSGMMAGATMQAAYASASATRYAADQSRIASQYATDSSAANPTTMFQTINRGINSLVKVIEEGTNTTIYKDYLTNPFMQQGMIP